MLLRSGRMLKPAVVGDVDEQITAVKHELPDKVADGDFETNQRRDMNCRIGQGENGVLGPGREISRDPCAGDRRKKRKGISQRNVFAERNEMVLPLNLKALAAVRDK